MASTEFNPIPGYPTVTIEPNVRMTMRDGVSLMADVYHPRGEGPFPALVLRTPYNKLTAQSELAFAHPAWYASHGYIVIIQDTRGRWASEGDFVPFLHEAEDGFDTIELAAALENCTGEVGTFGFSYAGLNQLLTAALQPPSLRAISPSFTSSSAYEGWSYQQGAPAIGFLTYWSAFLGLGDSARRSDWGALAQLANDMNTGASTWALPSTADPVLTSENVPYLHDWLEHPAYDDFWRRWTLDEDFSRIIVPGLHVLGQWDLFAKGNVRTFLGLREHSQASTEQKLLVVPFPHYPWSPVEPGVDVGANAVDDWQLRFFDEHLKKAPSDVHASAVTAFVVGAGWRDFDSWPAGSGQDLILDSAGRANTAWGDGILAEGTPSLGQADIFIYDPARPTVSEGGHGLGTEGIHPMGPAVQTANERSKLALVYTGEALAAPLTLVGNVVAHLHASTSATDTDFVVRLHEVDELGVSRNIAEGIVRASHRDGSTDPSPVTPGDVYEYRIDLGPIARVVPAGSRLRVLVASSDFPQWGRHTNMGVSDTSGAFQFAVQTIFHDAEHPSRISLPVVEMPR